MTRSWLPIALFALFTWGSPCALGQTEIPEIRCEGSVGLDGSRVVDNAYNPFHLTFTNTLEDFEGTLQIWVTRAVEERPRQQVALVYDRPFDLPMNSRKMVDGLMFIPEEETELEIRLVNPNGSIHSTFFSGFGNLMLERRVVLVVDRNGEQWQSIRTPVEALEGLARQIVPIDPEIFPSHWAALAPVSTILWDGDRWPSTPEATTAIGEWLNRGGVLVVGVGAGWSLIQTTPLADHLPLRVGEAAAVEASVAEGEMPLNLEEPLVLASIDESSLPAGARTLCRVGERPLLITWPVGEGHVIVSAATLASLWRSAHSQREVLSAFIVTPHAPRIPRGPLDDSLIDISRGIAGIGRVNLPDAGVIGRWLVALWVIVVPGAFAVARAIRRPRMAWVLCPALAAAATAHVFHVGLSGILPYQPVQQIQVVTSTPKSPEATLRGVVAIYAPTEETYSLRYTEDDVALGPLLGAGSVTGAREEYHLSPGRQGGLFNFRMPFGALRSFATDAVVENPVPVALHAEEGATPDELVVSWDAALAPHGTSWFLMWDSLAHAISDELIYTASEITVNRANGVDPARFSPVSDADPAQEGINRAVMSGLSSMLRREADRLSPVCLVGMRNHALLDLTVITERGAQQIQENMDAGTAILIASVPLAISPDAAAPWSEWRNRVTMPNNIFGYDINGDRYQILINGTGDVALLFSPRFDDWRSQDLQRITLQATIGNSPMQNTNYPNWRQSGQTDVKLNVALLNWRTQEWVVRTANTRLDRFTWITPEEFMHPLTGDVVGALWLTRQVPGSVSMSLKDEDWDWTRGPDRDRTPDNIGDRASIQLQNFTVTEGDKRDEEAGDD